MREPEDLLETSKQSAKDAAEMPVLTKVLAQSLTERGRDQALTRLLAFARAVEPFVADAAHRGLFGRDKSREIYGECLRIRDIVWAAKAGELYAERDLAEEGK